MSSGTAPTWTQVAGAIAKREIGIARTRRIVKILFLLNLVPPLVMAVVLVVRVFARQTGVPIDFDPLVQFIEIQAAPVLFLALAIGTPSVARDRLEDVLFLYATRPVNAWSYTFGKLAAVAIPCVLLLAVPGFLMAILRTGIIPEISAMDSATLFGKILVVALFVAIGYAGLSVGASAATQKARWALVVAFAAIALPQLASNLVWRQGDFALDAPNAVELMIGSLFGSGDALTGAVSILVLVAWGVLGAAVTGLTVRREMTP